MVAQDFFQLTPATVNVNVNAKPLRPRSLYIPEPFFKDPSTSETTLRIRGRTGVVELMPGH